MGVPLLFTEPGGGTPDLTVVPFPGLFLEDELFLSDDLYLDDGPTLQFYAEPPAVGSFGVTVTVDPVAVTFSGGDAVLVGVDEVVFAVDAGTVTFDAVAPSVAGQDVVVVVDGSSPVTFGAEIPVTTGGQLIILVPSVRELPPLRLSHSLETPSGRFFRWGEDEPNPANVPNGVRFSDTMPGGFETADAVLPRKPGTDYADLVRLSTWKVYGAGGEPAGEYRLERAPRVSGDQMAISPSAVGYQAALDDNKSATEVYVDAGLGGWRGPGITRQLALANAPVSLGEQGIEADPSGVPGLKLSFSGVFGSGFGPRAETYYQAPPTTRLSLLYAEWTTNPNVGLGAGNWILVPYTSDDETAFFEAGTDQLTGAASSGSFFYTPVTPRRMMMVQLGFLATPSGGDGIEYAVFLRNVRVFGDHGLTLYNNASGVLASDVVRHAVSTWAPQLTVSALTVSASGFVIPQLAFPEPTTAAEIVRQATRFGLQDWAVWDDKTFWWHDRGAWGRKWRARISPAQLEETGPSLDRTWESILVQYTDVDGSTRTVGPPGSGADVEDPVLKDNDPENPANQAGIIRRDLLQMGTSTVAGAIEVGRQFLERAKELDNSGRARFVGHVMSDKGVLHPYYAPRAGDTVVFTDAASTGERRIVRTEKDHASRTCSVDLDAPPEGLQALLERLGVVLVPLGFN